MRYKGKERKDEARQKNQTNVFTIRLCLIEKSNWNFWQWISDLENYFDVFFFCCVSSDGCRDTVNDCVCIAAVCVCFWSARPWVRVRMFDDGVREKNYKFCINKILIRWCLVWSERRFIFGTKEFSSRQDFWGKNFLLLGTSISGLGHLGSFQDNPIKYEGAHWVGLIHQFRASPIKPPNPSDESPVNELSEEPHSERRHDICKTNQSKTP